MKKNLIPLLLACTAIAACSNNKSSGGGTTEEAPVNPLVGGQLPTEKAKIYVGNGSTNRAESGKGYYIFDPVGKKFEYFDNRSSTTYTGSFDPASGDMKIQKCAITDPEEGQVCAMPIGTVLNINDDLVDMVGDSLVTLSPESLSYYGYELTRKDNMPSSGSVIYVGDVLVNNNGGAANQGEVTTTVDFDTDTLGATFQKFDGDLAGYTGALTGVKVNGNKFEAVKGAGGFTYSDATGNTVSTGGDVRVVGDFFGATGQELGGAFSYSDAAKNINLLGAWNGEAE